MFSYIIRITNMATVRSFKIVSDKFRVMEICSVETAHGMDHL